MDKDQGDLVSTLSVIQEKNLQPIVRIVKPAQKSVYRRVLCSEQRLAVIRNSRVTGTIPGLRKRQSRVQPAQRTRRWHELAQDAIHRCMYTLRVSDQAGRKVHHWRRNHRCEMRQLASHR